MIHYHGGPIWPVTAAFRLWRARHAFVSFARPEQIDIAASEAQSFALDNGAFSAWKSGTAVDWNAYYEWVGSWMRHPGFDFALIPDVVDGNVGDNVELIEAWPHGKQCGVPVWHMHEPLEYLVDLAVQFPRVALGSSAQFAEVGTSQWWNRMSEAMRAVCDEEGRPPCKLHGLRMLNPEVFGRLPFASADSTNVAQNITKDTKWKGTYPPRNKETRAIVIAERIEETNSASVWEGAHQPCLFGGSP